MQITHGFLKQLILILDTEASSVFSCDPTSFSCLALFLQAVTSSFCAPTHEMVPWILAALVLLWVRSHPGMEEEYWNSPDGMKTSSSFQIASAFHRHLKEVFSVLLVWKTLNSCRQKHVRQKHGLLTVMVYVPAQLTVLCIWVFMEKKELQCKGSRCHCQTKNHRQLWVNKVHSILGLWGVRLDLILEIEGFQVEE